MNLAMFLATLFCVWCWLSYIPCSLGLLPSIYHLFPLSPAPCSPVLLPSWPLSSSPLFLSPPAPCLPVPLLFCLSPCPLTCSQAWSELFHSFLPWVVRILEELGEGKTMVKIYCLEKDFNGKGWFYPSHFQTINNKMVFTYKLTQLISSQLTFSLMCRE